MSVANESARYGTTPTARELEILRTWDETRNAETAAKRLGISEDGVRRMLANVRARAGVRESADAVHVFLVAGTRTGQSK